MPASGTIRFLFNDQLICLDPGRDSLSPTTTLLQWLRAHPDTKGTKEGCAEGDCGACTIVLGELTPEDTIRYTAIDSCLVFLPMLDGKQLITVECLAGQPLEKDDLHPVQRAMVDSDGSQCGYCTPGFIMSLFALYKQPQRADRDEIRDALAGNLCRCTGYRPIAEAAAHACAAPAADAFTSSEPATVAALRELASAAGTLEIKTSSQRYLRPMSLQEALKAKAQDPAWLPVNGATDLALRVTKRHEVLPALLDLSGIDSLRSIEHLPQAVRIGAGCSLETIRRELREQLPALTSILDVFGSRQIRSLATFGGNLGSASPIGDTLPLLFAYGATVHLQSSNDRRDIPIDRFITGYRETVRRPDELITGITVPLPSADDLVRAFKVSKRKDLDIATVSGAFRLRLVGDRIEEAVFAFGGMAASTQRVFPAEDLLRGRTWTRANAEAAAEIVYNHFTPLSDARSGAEFRRIAARNLVLKYWAETTGMSTGSPN
jgi:xanthine dehydrogenase small subunit